MGEVMPNVRVEAGSRASHRARTSENIQRTTGWAWRLAVRPRLKRGVRPHCSLAAAVSALQTPTL